MSDVRTSVELETGLTIPMIDLGPCIAGGPAAIDPEPLSFGEYLADINRKNYDLPADDKSQH